MLQITVLAVESSLEWMTRLLGIILSDCAVFITAGSIAAALALAIYERYEYSVVAALFPSFFVTLFLIAEPEVVDLDALAVYYTGAVFSILLILIFSLARRYSRAVRMRRVLTSGVATAQPILPRRRTPHGLTASPSPGTESGPGRSSSTTAQVSPQQRRFLIRAPSTTVLPLTPSLPRLVPVQGSRGGEEKSSEVTVLPHRGILEKLRTPITLVLVAHDLTDLSEKLSSLERELEERLQVLRRRRNHVEALVKLTSTSGRSAKLIHRLLVENCSFEILDTFDVHTVRLLDEQIRREILLLSQVRELLEEVEKLRTEPELSQRPVLISVRGSFVEELVVVGGT